MSLFAAPSIASSLNRRQSLRWAGAAVVGVAGLPGLARANDYEDYSRALISDNASAMGGGQIARWKEFRERTLQAAGRTYFRELMEAAGGDVKKACELSGLSQPRLYALLKEHDVSKRFAT